MTELEKNAEELAYKWWHSVDKEFVDVIDAYVQGYKDAIDKACEWLKCNFNMPDDFESHFRKAMEENK